MAVGPNDFLSVEDFYRDFVPAVIDGQAAIFAGAGLSRSAGFVDWKGLLRAFAIELGLDLDVESDLVAVAQYHLNREGRIRNRLNQKVVDEFDRAATSTEAHLTIAALPIATIWTSNYDSLIEDALVASGAVTTIRSPGKSLTVTKRGATREVLKLHGDVSDPDRVVITKEDYERYARDNEGFLLRLKNDLISKSFLFVGFSFADPNLELILSQVRSVVGDSPRTHYAIFRQPARGEFAKPATYRYELNKWRLRLQDLRRYGIQAVVVTDYDDLPDVLRQLRLRVQRKRILVSGSFDQADPWTRVRLEGFCQQLGQRIIRGGFDLVNGFGVGVGNPLIGGAAEELYRAPAPAIERRLILRPFPQAQPRRMTRAQLWEQYRRDLVAPAGFAVFVAGNKLDAHGAIVAADGVRAEFDLAVAQSTYVLPIGATGSVARELWDEVMADPGSYYPTKVPRRLLRRLGSKTATDGQLLDATFDLIEWLSHAKN